jgi:hypothetical protein
LADPETARRQHGDKKTPERYLDRSYTTLQAAAEKTADLDARMRAEEVGVEIELLGKALGEKLAALDHEIRLRDARTSPRWRPRLRRTTRISDGLLAQMSNSIDQPQPDQEAV